MPEPDRQNERTAAERQADHAGLARLSETLVPALVQKLNGSGLGELEVREGDWKVRLRRPTGTAATTPVRRDRPRSGSHAPARPAPAAAHPEARDPHRVATTSPAVGVFRATSATGSRVRSGDRIGVVDLLGIPQDVVAPADGILVELLVETGDAVEYGEEVAIIAEPLPGSEAQADSAASGGEG